MDDSEVEAVLVALGGPSLEWTPNFELRDEQNRVMPGEIAVGTGGCYLVLYHRFLFWRGHFPQFVTPGMAKTISSFRFYKQLSDAKAACERHHVTGKWDS